MCWIYLLSCWGPNLYCKSYYCDCTCHEFGSGDWNQLKTRCNDAGKNSTYQEWKYNLTCTEKELGSCTRSGILWLKEETEEISNRTLKKYLYCYPKPTPTRSQTRSLIRSPMETPIETPKMTPQETLARTPMETLAITPIRTLFFTPFETPSRNLIESKILYQEPNDPYLYFIIPIVVLSLVNIVLLILYCRRKKTTQETSEESETSQTEPRITRSQSFPNFTITIDSYMADEDPFSQDFHSDPGSEVIEN